MGYIYRNYMLFVRTFTLSLPLVFFVFLSGASATNHSLVEAMANHLTCYPVELLNLDKQNPTITRKDVCLASIYHETGAMPLWVTMDGPGEKAEVILSYLQNAGSEGLDPEDYQVEKLLTLWQDQTLETLAILDTLLTYNIVKYVHDVRHGQVKPFMVDPKLFAEAGDSGFDPVVTIEQLLALGGAEELESFLRQLPPQNEHYRGLREGLAAFREIEKREGWQKIDTGKSIRPGDSDPRIPLIRKNLAVLKGETIYTGEEDILYGEELKEELLLFQSRYGLETDGIIGKKTIAELNVTPSERVDQIRINMARWRWQDHSFGDEYIIVNIADYTLHAYREGELALSLPVIVGKFQHQTPVFSDRLRYVEFNPFWNVPPSIARNEELPELRENPLHLVDRKIRLFSSWMADAVELDSTIIDWDQITRREMSRYKLRQDPGPENALGRVKFVFPNHYSVYLHDTPSKKLFSEQYRSFSHGCIRVSQPEKLALFVLEGEEQGWDEIRINQLFDDSSRRVVRVRRSLPIHLTYQTAWLDKSGQIHFNKDVYARDRKLHTILLSK